MNLQVNGRSVKMEDEEMTIAEILAFYQVQDKVSVVEHNKQIVKKSDYETKKIKDNDTLEIIHFVGGG
ncbi:sulfur carrier protein ThiS [Halobacillus massiliensis]|uniref:sulfur carrier protein ThiS n=1 Tax=Halobacillus massiliensis TaxID=1926286 RepID=UPI0009E3C9CF|nr:sulfur carrier protein ThiS [Halobacillus massiliensis]